MLINVTLPVYNEEAQLAATVQQLVKALPASGVRTAGRVDDVSWEIVIAENGSRDGTQKIGEKLVREHAKGGPAEVLLRHRAIAGRGGALKEAWEASEAEILTYMDVDLSTDLGDFPRLLAPLLTHEADVVVGSRLAAGAETRRSWKREVLSRGYNRLLHGALGLPVRDAQCGFKAISRAAATQLLPQVEDEGWFFDTELLWRAHRAGLRIVEIPVRWVEDRDTRVRLLWTIWRDLCGMWRLWREGWGRRGPGEEV
ncbi:MAG: glycosyltransferase family 2 protein [Verrucomicrobiales bacterium]|nr:glycosyltransferase family 2 protein [Verrucomicrobiales bacterium]